MLRRLLACVAITALLGSGASGQDAASDILGDIVGSGVSEQAKFVHKWAATLALLALQTNDNNLPGAQLTIDTIEALTLQAISNAAAGRPFTAEEAVLADAGIDLNKTKNVNITEVVQEIAEGNLDAGVAGILGVINSNATELLNGLITITDPEVFADSSAKLQAGALGAIVAATGISYSPCVAAALPAGAVLFAEAIAISPELVEVSAAGAAVVAIAIDIAPTLINIGGSDKAGVAIGVGVTPTLIEVAPAISEDIKAGVSIGPAAPLKTVTVPRPGPMPPEPPMIPGPP